MKYRDYEIVLKGNSKEGDRFKTCLFKKTSTFGIRFLLTTYDTKNKFHFKPKSFWAPWWDPSRTGHRAFNAFKASKA